MVLRLWVHCLACLKIYKLWAGFCGRNDLTKDPVVSAVA